MEVSCLQILAMADVVEAIASHRPYHPALRLDVTLAEIEKSMSASTTGRWLMFV